MESSFLPNVMMSQEDMMKTRAITDAVNKQVFDGKIYKNEMDKDAFLKLLITQLANQDPMQPLEDKEFIAQMAQFSTLEQMNNMSAGFENLTSGLQNLSHLIAGNNALSMLGKVVEIDTDDGIIKGLVEKVSGGETQQVFVGGRYYDYQAVMSISSDTSKEENY
ncbi:MAG: flagellar hook assembly protein FlgD [Spirochaetales bacterium]|nr:flagellar hook assembly protein FlgD [Spirochaetales bacterium]